MQTLWRMAVASRDLFRMQQTASTEAMNRVLIPQPAPPVPYRPDFRGEAVAHTVFDAVGYLSLLRAKLEIAAVLAERDAERDQ